MASTQESIAMGNQLCSYAALILYEEQLDITAENLNKIIKASGNIVPAFLPTLFAKYIEEVDIKQMLSSATTAPASAAAPAASGGAVQKAEEEEKPQEDDDKASVASDESDGSMGFGLFD